MSPCCWVLTIFPPNKQVHTIYFFQFFYVWHSHFPYAEWRNWLGLAWLGLTWLGFVLTGYRQGSTTRHWSFSRQPWRLRKRSWELGHIAWSNSTLWWPRSTMRWGGAAACAINNTEDKQQPVGDRNHAECCNRKFAVVHGRPFFVCFGSIFDLTGCFEVDQFRSCVKV